MKLFLIIVFLLLRANVFAAEDPIAEKITQAQATGKKIVLVLGATPPESGNLKFPGFDPDPFVVYLNDIHFRDIEHLKSAKASTEIAADWEKQFVQGDFNDLEALQLLQDRFSACFDLITLDFSVSRFMNLTGQQLQRFLGMLNIGGTMVFDYSTGCSVIALKENVPITSDEKALELCLEWLNPTEERLEYKPHLKINWRDEMTSESVQLLRDFYSQYLRGWKTLHMPDTCELYVVEDSVFPYWQATGHTDRDRWISGPKDYLVMRRLR